jgi:hypothetical protein
MNCCDYGCTQGRDCPARAPSAKVAKIKRRTPKYPQVLRAGQALRGHMRRLAKWMLIAIATSVAASVLVGVMR